MSRKRSSRNLQDDIDGVENTDHGDFIGIKSKNFKSNISCTNIDRKDLKLGTLLLGVIDNVTEKELIISFPGSNTAILSAENTIEESEEIPIELMKELSKKSLKERFSVGQFVNGAVISNNKIKNNFTLKPSILNAGLNSNSKCLNVFGYVISGLIISKENHGFNIYTGIQGVKTTFMKVDETQSRNYRLGQILPVNINKYFKEKSLLICTPIYQMDENSKICKKEILSIHEIKPGLLVECLIHSYAESTQKPERNQIQSPNKKKKISDKVGVQPNTKLLQLKNIDRQYLNDQDLESIQNYLQDSHSIQVSFCMGTMLGVIPDEHSIHPLSCFYPQEFESSLTLEDFRNPPKSKFINARIIAVLSGTENKIVLSILPHIINPTNLSSNSNSEISIGTIISPSGLQVDHHTQVLDSHSTITLLTSKNQNKTLTKVNFIARISDQWVSFSTKQFTKDYEKTEQAIKTQPFRVISHSRLENSHFVSFDQKALQEKYFLSSDVLPGQIVKATVAEINNWGISVRLSEYFSGRVYAEHLFNSSGSGSSVSIHSSSNSSKTMSKEQMNYIKKHYQIGRTYQFKVLRYEYSDNSWNPLLLLTAKQLLINDQLPIIKSIDESIQIGQKATGYISRICFETAQRYHSESDSNSPGKNDYIIIRFYGEAYGSLSYKEYVDYYESETLEGISKKPAIGEIITVQIKSIDLNSKSLKLTLRMQDCGIQDPKMNSNSPLNRHFLTKFASLSYSFYEGIFDQVKNKEFVLLGTTTQGLLFSQNLNDLIYVPKYNISDNKSNSERIYNLIRQIFHQSKSVSEFNSKIFKLKFAPKTLNNGLFRQNLEIDLSQNSGPNNSSRDNNSITLNLNVKIAYLKHSTLNGGAVTVNNFKSLATSTLCLGYINHIDHYGLLVSVLSSEPLTGIVPRHLISSKVFYDSKEQLMRHFSIGETLILKLIKLDETSKKITLSLKDLEDGRAFTRNPSTTKAVIKERLKGLERDEQIIKHLISKALRSKQEIDSTINDSSIIGRLIELNISSKIENDGIYIGKLVHNNQSKRDIYFKIINEDKDQDSKKELSTGKTIHGLVLGGNYLFETSSKISEEAYSEAKYVYYICCQDQIVERFSKVFDKTENTENTKLNRKYSKFLETFVNGTKSINIKNDNHITYQTESLAVSILMTKSSQEEELPVIVLYPKIILEGGKMALENLNCMILGQSSNLPILLGTLYSNKDSAASSKSETSKKVSLEVGSKVKCKIIEHLNSYRGLIVELPNKSCGRISILELDDDKIDHPLALDKFKVGKTIQGIIIDHLKGENKKSKRVNIMNKKSSKAKYVTLEYEVSSCISRIRDIQDDKDELKDIKSFSQVKTGSVLSGYVCNSGKEGVFVCIGRELVGRIKLRELTMGTITPEEASKKFFIGKFINQMVVVNKNKQEKKIDLSISKLDSDDIKLRLSQMNEIDQEDVEMEIDQEDGTGTQVKIPQSLGNINEKLSFEDLYVGRILAGVVTNVSKKHGLFIRLNDLKDNLTALCKISECLDSESNSSTVSSVFNVGDNVLCKVLKLKTEKGRVWVGIKPSYFSEMKGDEDNFFNLGKKEIKDTETDTFEDTSENGDTEMTLEFNDEGLEYRESDQMNDEGLLSKVDVYGKTKSLDLGDDDDNNNNNNNNNNSNNESESKLETKNLNRKQKVQRQLEHEHKIREEEEKGMRSHLNPSSIDDFERLLVTHKDVSSLWIRYMSYYLDLGDLDKARVVAERSLRQISVKEEMERWNIWIAYINMEIVYGKNELFNNKDEVKISSLGKDGIPRNVRQVLDRALMNVTDQKKLYMQIFNSLRKYSKEEQALAIMEEGLKKFQTSRKLWITYLTCLYETDKQNKARDEVIQKSLKCVSKHKLIRLITDIGRLEFEYGNINRGRTIFENLLEENSKRMDLWSQYFDILTKLCSNGSSQSQNKSQSCASDYIEMTRSIFSSCLDKNFKPRSMKMIFTRWLSFEKQFGSLQSQKRVQDSAISYVNKVESNL